LHAFNKDGSTKQAIVLNQNGEIPVGGAGNAVQLYTASADMSTRAAVTAAPTTGKKIYVDEFVISSAAALNFTLSSETSTTALFKLYVAANSTVTVKLATGLTVDAINDKLFCVASGAGAFTILTNAHSVS
jgi:hypothetical protein